MIVVNIKEKKQQNGSNLNPINYFNMTKAFG